MPILLGDAFRKNGVEVLYSCEADNDDTLAAYAERDGADILSGDQDFFRYTGHKYKIFANYEIDRITKRLNVVPLEKNNNRWTSPRTIIMPPPATAPQLDILAPNFPSSQPTYMRGAPSPLVRRLGNPHITVRPLRRALYARRNFQNPVLEVFPEWDSESDSVVWTEDSIEPDDTLDALLDSPAKAFVLLFPDAVRVKPDDVEQKEWDDHIFALHAVTYELCVAGGKSWSSLLELMSHASRSRIDEERESGLGTARLPPPPAYVFECRDCKRTSSLSYGEVKFYEKNNYQMPKTCKECKAIRSRKYQCDNVRA